MSVVLLRLRGVLQSWGSWSASRDRTTETYPTKSGVIGLIANAMGRDRSDPIHDLASLRMGVGEIDRGSAFFDYQTIGGGYDWWEAMALDEPGSRRNRQRVLSERADAVIRQKAYLENADFIAGLEGHADLIDSVVAALEDPARSLFLGRKGCPPSHPVFAGRDEGDLEGALESWRGGAGERASRLVIEVPYRDGEERTHDAPIHFGRREYGVRSIAYRLTTGAPA